MFVPEYTITPKTLRNISTIEYSRAIIENTTILQNFEIRLEKDTSIESIVHTLAFSGKKVSSELVRKKVDDIEKSAIPAIDNLIKAHILTKEISGNQEFEESDLMLFQETLLDSECKYRSRKISGKTDPEEILAEVVELFDWYNSLDARDTNTIIVAGLIKGQLELIEPFETTTFHASNLSALTTLYSAGYNFARYLCLECFYNTTKKQYADSVAALVEDGDFTTWLEYFTEGFASQTANVEQKVKLLAKDTRIAKVTGRVHLSSRQEKIVEYLQDYGILQNKSFVLLFPNISEDSVLRDLKGLIDKGIVAKRGSTKSSRYELA